MVTNGHECVVPEPRSVDWIVCAVALGVIIVCGLIVHRGTSPLEQRVFRWINGLPDLLSSPMRIAQFLGVIAVGPIVAIGAAVFRKWRLALAALIVAIGKLGAERIVWPFVQRCRPGTTIPGAIVRGNTPTSGVAFDSGHLVLVTGLAWVLPLSRREMEDPAVGSRGLFAFARIYLGALGRLDVIGGVGVGLTRWGREPDRGVETRDAFTGHGSGSRHPDVAR